MDTVVVDQSDAVYAAVILGTAACIDHGGHRQAPMPWASARNPTTIAMTIRMTTTPKTANSSCRPRNRTARTTEQEPSALDRSVTDRCYSEHENPSFPDAAFPKKVPKSSFIQGGLMGVSRVRTLTVMDGFTYR